MPKVRRPRPKPLRKRTQQEIRLAIAEAAWKEFEDPAAWKRSKKGNLWRLWEGLTVTVFKRSDEYWGWSIAGATGVRYSPEGYEIEGEAVEALESALEVGRW